MFLRSSLSILGMYQFDNTLFDDITIPEGIDKQTMIDTIIFNCAELEVIYTDPDILKYAITSWVVAEYKIWEKMLYTVNVDYNPIWNVDADIKRTTDRNIDRSGESSAVNSVKGYNSNSWSESEKTDSEYNDNTGEATIETERRSGNIGVTATQDLLKKEREIADFNIYDFIAKSFKKRFCIMVY